MIEQHIMAPFQTIIAASDAELPQVLMKVSLPDYRDCLIFDSTNQTWFAFGSRTGWNALQDDKQILPLIHDAVHRVGSRLKAQIRRCHRMLKSKNLYRVTNGIDTLIASYLQHSREICSRSECHAFILQCLPFAKRFLDSPGALDKFNRDTSVLGCSVDGNKAALLDCTTMAITTDVKRVQEAKCTQRLQVTSTLNQAVSSNAWDQHDDARFVASQLADAVFRRAPCMRIDALQLQGGTSTTRLVNTIHQALGDYAVLLQGVVRQQQLQRIANGVRIVFVADNDKLAVQCLQRAHDMTPKPLVVLYRANDHNRSISKSLHRQANGKFVCFSIPSQLAPPESIDTAWQWLVGNAALDAPPIPHALTRQSNPAEQHKEAIDALISQCGWSPHPTTSHPVKSIIGMSSVSQQLHTLAIHELGLASFSMSQIEIGNLLHAHRQFIVQRPRGYRQVTVYMKESCASKETE